MSIGYEMVERRAKLFAELAEEAWKRDHVDAMHALEVNALYENSIGLVGLALKLDEIFREAKRCQADDPRLPQCETERTRAFKATVTLLRQLNKLCVASKVAEYGYEASVQKVEQLESIMKQLLRGVVVIDSKAEAAAFEARGEAIGLDELRRRLRGRHP